MNRNHSLHRRRPTLLASIGALAGPVRVVASSFAALLVVGFVGVAGGCTTFFDTDLGDARAVDGGVNACGGEATLQYDGADAAVGDRCGPCGGGFLVCNGTDSLRCLGAAEENACGGCAPLVAEPNDPCGFCGDGYFTCDGTNEVVCTHASFPNGCGGCAELPGAPGFPCRTGGGEAEVGTWVCTSPTSVECQSGDRNACGGSQTLQHQGVITTPGQPCAGDCVDGILVCDGQNALDCRGAEDANACGGCSVLPGEPGAACGPCGTGTWSCTVDGGMECDTEAPNVCGGCEVFSEAAAPGGACAGGTVICNTADTSICAALGEDTNACGGIGQLEAAPGDACGTCDSGLWTCADVARVTCEGDRGDDARNACGGCAPLAGEPGARCGTCGSGVWECDGEDAVVCAGDDEDEATNECGGCGRLWGTVGAACAECYSFDCLAEGERLQCVFDSVEDAAADECGPPPTCETQGCEILNRECLTDDEGRPYCGGCIEGFFNIAGECVGAQCAGDGDCPEPPAGQWGECEPNTPPCSYDGTRTRVGRTTACIDGTCQLITEPIVEDCRMNTDGRVVSEEPDISECVPAATGEECSVNGTQTVTQIVCSDQRPEEERTSRACDRDPTGDACGDDLAGVCSDEGVCEGGTVRLRVGASCTTSDQCSSTNCSHGVCAPRGMVTVFAGRFDMGSSVLDLLPPTEETPQHQVVLTRDFFVSATEVSSDEYMAVTAVRPGGSGTEPVSNVRWSDALEFCNALSRREGLGECYVGAADGTGGVTFDYDCTGYRLLTEAEFEYALRAGSSAAYHCGALPTCLRDNTVYASTDVDNPQPVGAGREPNEWGLYDMAGNVAEWVWDRYDADYYRSSPGTDPVGPTEGANRSVRGGSYESDATEVRSAARAAAPPTTRTGTIGFRIARNRPDVDEP